MAVLDKSKQLKKELRLFNVYAIATGATIASGFFLLPGIAFSQAGPAVILSYALAAIPLIPAVLSMAELSTAMPRAGGIYYFLDRSMGPLFGTLGGIGTWFTLSLKSAFALIGMGVYLNIFFPDIPLVPLACGSAVFFGIVNLLGVKKTGGFQAILVLGLLLLLGWFTGSSLDDVHPENFYGFFDRGAAALFETTGMVFVSYIGLTKIASVAEEVNKPEKTIPLGMLLAFVTALVVYTIGTYLMVGVLPARQLSGDLTPVASTAMQTMGGRGRIIVSIAAVLAFFSVANAGILSASRYPLGMSRDHLLPPFFQQLTEHKIPRNAILCTVFLIILSLLFFDPVRIAKLAGAFQLLLFAVTCCAVIIMRESHIHSYDPGFRSPFYPWTQIAGIIASIILIAGMGWLPVVFSLALIGAGTGWYLAYARRRVVRDGAIYHIFARLGELRYEGLDPELRGIMREKGLRDQDPFDVVIANADIIDIKVNVSFEEVVEKASDSLSGKLNTDPRVLVKGFLQGTRVGATPVSHGVALPHLRLPDIPHPVLTAVRSVHGVVIDIDNEFLGQHAPLFPVYAFFFLVSPEDNPSQHLRILAQIAEQVDGKHFLDQWLSAETPQLMKEILTRHDRTISLLLSTDLKTSGFVGRTVGEVDIPVGTLIAIVQRRGETIVPEAGTLLEEGDFITIIGSPAGIRQMYLRYHVNED